ncbi:hypothetical protein HN51_032347 [Arachis hypogaea]
MDWGYHEGWRLIGAIVVIWVTSAEITQRIFMEYKQPFAITYHGVFLMMPEPDLKTPLVSYTEELSTREKLHVMN